MVRPTPKKMASENLLRSYSIIPCFIFVELVIMAGTVLLAYYMECTDTFSVHIQGFFCNDADLLKPYPGLEEDSFVPPLILYCVVAAAPTAVIFIGEVSMYIVKSTREALIAQEKTIVTGECCYLNPLIRRIIRFIGVFAFGLFATDIFANAGQIVTGNLSPYFLNVCKPNYTGTDCRSNHQFIANGNICTGDQAVVERARRSFPSKDASLSIYSAVYMTMYITSTIKTKSSRLAKPALCLSTLCAAFLMGLNRVSEYRNHCSDVIAGFILGSTIALFLGICVVHNFKGVHAAPVKRKGEEYRGLPLMTFPRVESPLETLSAQNHAASMTEVT
ncbi:phospholipid phosphatase-related protein type 1 [Brienomyrus brachyistius]|uniref:phospholipid phosphatase-related protein type 1 n=1 Tax=Brienomyrus brachyistius TaxID=42636 RepID=UPI0020B25A75|nr:phospholipid phosphatase-related protein type 1 [Brienomyrus brachyistius]XP_048877015.1 phospholipid phosphatase-related protein type 1 [Brienomyrus brachyistius]XP_048877016.1 phospholipid phosphatase-related protein type 1 [Brienomyrus brachyistius]